MDRDDEKQIGIKTAYFRGHDYNKADITLIVPVDLRVDTEIILNQGPTLFNGRIDISYSKSKHKTVTLFSRIDDRRHDRNGFNYSVEIGLSHPQTRTDMIIDTHFGVTGGLLTSSAGLSYLTSQREMVNMALSTEIDSNKKYILISTDIPGQSVDLYSHVVTDTPLHVAIKQYIDGQEAFFSNFSMDGHNTQIHIEMGEPDDFLCYNSHFQSRFAWLNTLTRKQRMQVDLQEALAEFRLTSPMVLYAALDWRPHTFTRAREWLVYMINLKRKQIKAHVKKTALSVEHEIKDKYHGFVQSISGDTHPLFNFIDVELTSIGKDIGFLEQDLRDIMKNNVFFLGSILRAKRSIREEYNYVISQLRHFRIKTSENRRWLLRTISQLIRTIKDSETRINFLETVSAVVNPEMELVDIISSRLLHLLDTVDMELSDIKEWSPYTSFQDFYTYKLLKFLKSRLNVDFIRSKVQKKWSVLRKPIERYLQGLVPEQVQYVLDYWVDQQLLTERLRLVLKVLRGQIQEKMPRFTYPVRLMDRKLITIYDPEKGEIRSNIDLPFALKRLDQVPDFKYYKDTMRMILRRIRDRI